jgi:hypothetical protein
VYSLVRVRDGAMSRYRGYQIPWEWMQDTGIVSQVLQVNSFSLGKNMLIELMNIIGFNHSSFSPKIL